MDLRLLTLALAITLAPGSAFAEVSDKFPDPLMHWVWAVPAAAAVYFGARYSKWLAAPFALLLAAVLWSSIQLARDPDVGEALWREQGWGFFGHLWGTNILLLVAWATGALATMRSRGPAA